MTHTPIYMKPQHAKRASTRCSPGCVCLCSESSHLASITPENSRKTQLSSDHGASQLDMHAEASEPAIEAAHRACSTSNAVSRDTWAFHVSSHPVPVGHICVKTNRDSMHNTRSAALPTRQSESF